MTILRPQQTTARHQINRILNAGGNPVYVSPTGTGKTKTIVQVVADRIKLGERVFIITPQEEILDQWRIEFYENNIDAGYIDRTGVNGRNKRVYVCMPISLNNILSLLPERFYPDLIVTDECHHSAAATWENIYAYFPKAKRLGATATLIRYDGIGFDHLYTHIVETITMQEAIDLGYLAQPLTVVPEQYHMDIRINNGDFDVQEQARLLGKTKIIGNVIEQYSNIFCGLPVLVACSTFKHAETMAESLTEPGWRFAHIHSGMRHEERKSLLYKIRTGKLNGLCTVGIGIEGLDIPGLYGLIWLRRTMSLTIFLQFTGRVLRPFLGKQYGIIIDPVGNTFIHGRPELYRPPSLYGAKDRPVQDIVIPRMKICPQCGVMNAEENIECHICGFDFTTYIPGTLHPRKIPTMVDGNMVIIDAEKLAVRKEEIKEKLFQQRKEATREKEKETVPIELSENQKMTLLKNGLARKKGVFAEAIKNYL